MVNCSLNLIKVDHTLKLYANFNVNAMVKPEKIVNLEYYYV